MLFYFFIKREMQRVLMAVLPAMLFIAMLFVGSGNAAVQVGVAATVIPQTRGGIASEALKTIAVGAHIDSEMLIETGQSGRTQVLFIDGSSINIGPASRVIIDRFVFDPTQLRGTLSANVQEGSLRFIGGVLSKTANQVRFNVGAATIGIRGGIVKINREIDGAIQAELVYGRLRVETPEGLYQTSRIGTVIARSAAGDVTTRIITPDGARQALDAEARESFAQEERVPEVVGVPEVPAVAETPDAPEARGLPAVAPINNSVAENQRTYISDAPDIELLLNTPLVGALTDSISSNIAANPSSRISSAPPRSITPLTSPPQQFVQQVTQQIAVPEAVREVVTATKEAEGATIKVFYNLHLAGQRVPEGRTQWGDGAPAYWLAYHARPDSSYLNLQANGLVVMNMAASSFSANSAAINNLIFGSATPIGTSRQSSLLGEHRFEFTNTLTAQTGQNGLRAAPRIAMPDKQQILQWHRIEDFNNLGRDIELRDYNMLATGLWLVESFTNTALDNITYRHQAHFAIGSALSASTIRALAGMTARFSGHAYGTISNATTSGAAGLGKVAVQVDFANPNNAQRNHWTLSDFVAGAVRVPTTSVGLALDTATARYSGSDARLGAQVDGALYGNINALQTGGTFSINTENYAVSGSFAAAQDDSSR